MNKISCISRGQSAECSNQEHNKPNGDEVMSVVCVCLFVCMLVGYGDMLVIH